MMGCAEIEKFVHPYVDGEFAPAESAQVELHLLECQRCRELVAFQSTFKSHLRSRLHRPMHEVPAALRVRVADALDRADASVRRPWRRAMPISAALVAAACAAFFLLRSMTSHADAALVAEAVRLHTTKLPVEVGGTDDDVKSWMIGKVSVPVRPPRIGCGACTVPVTLVGARVNHLYDRDVAQLIYRVGTSTLTVCVFDPSGWDLTSPVSRWVGNQQVFLGGWHGYNVLLYRSQGIGYVYISDLDHQDMVKLLSLTLHPRAEDGEE